MENVEQNLLYFSYVYVPLEFSTYLKLCSLLGDQLLPSIDSNPLTQHRLPTLCTLLQHIPLSQTQRQRIQHSQTMDAKSQHFRA